LLLFVPRKSRAWEAELEVVAREKARVETPQPDSMVTAERILELAKGQKSLQIAGSGGTAEIAGNGAIELHFR
jgi:hypothetical protein